MKTNDQNNHYELLTGHEVEAQYKIPIATQKKWRWMKYHGLEDYNGFPFIKIGRLIRYRRVELEEWLDATVEQEAGEERGVDRANPMPLGQLKLFTGKQ